MKYERYLKALKKNLWLILLLPALAGVVAGFVNYFILKPVYTSKTTLVVIGREYKENKSLGDYSDILTAQKVVKEYAEIIKSKTVAKSVIERLKLRGISPDGLRSRIGVRLKNDTRIFEVYILYSNPEEARLVLDCVVDEFSKHVIDIMKAENVGVIDPAEVYSTPIGPDRTKNVAISVLLGLFIAVLIILILDEMDRTVRDSKDIENKLGIKVLCVIPRFDTGRNVIS